MGLKFDPSIARATPPPGRLTRQPQKLELYRVDPYFRDTCDDIAALRASGTTAPDLWRHTFIIFRPDAIATRSVETGLQILRDVGFDVLDASIFHYNHLTVREGWRYQLNIATRDRIDAMDLIMTSGPSLFCLLRFRGEAGSVPASARLAAIKGPSAPEARRSGELRREMGPVQQSVLTFVHSPDEPADFIRELAVFLEPESRWRTVKALTTADSSVEPARLLQMVQDLYGRTPAHDLEVAGVVGGLDRPDFPRRDLLHRIARRETFDVRELLAELRAVAPALTALDLAAVAAAVGRRHIPEASPVLRDVDPLAWGAPAEARPA